MTDPATPPTGGTTPDDATATTPATATATDVIVVGAGFAGLTAARALTTAGFTVTIIEARDRVGGRTHTIERHGTTIDLGGQWVGPGQNRIAALVTEFGVSTWPQATAGDDMVAHPDGATRVSHLAESMTDDELMGYLDLVGRFETICATVDTNAPWATEGAHALDNQTLEQWVANQNVSISVAALFSVGVQAVFAATPAQLSLLHAAFYTQAAGGWSVLTDTEGGAQQDRVAGGLEHLARKLAAELGDAVRLGEPVHRIEHDNTGVSVHTNGGMYTARRVIVSLPPTLAGRITYDPPLGGRRDQLTQRMPQGSVIKFHVIYNEPWWRTLGLSGSVMDTTGAVGVTFDCTPPQGTPGIITGFFEGPHATEGARHGEPWRRNTVIGLLTKTLGRDAADPIDYIDMDWSAEPHTRGCYGAHLPPGAWTQVGDTLREPVGPIHWAGTETATQWVGYIDGAIESGHRASAEVINALS